MLVLYKKHITYSSANVFLWLVLLFLLCFPIIDHLVILLLIFSVLGEYNCNLKKKKAQKGYPRRNLCQLMK